MQKIISLFRRNYDKNPLVIQNNEGLPEILVPPHQVYDSVVPGAEWVLAGEGTASRKWDGTCCKIEGGQLYKRYDAKNGKTPPEGFMPAQDPDPVTGHWPGWLPVGMGKEDKWFREAIEGYGELSAEFEDGTYELVGPRINGNPEGFERHHLLQHGHIVFPHAPRTFDELKEWFKDKDIEGIVWHHPDGRMCKLKKKDMGLSRKPAAAQADY